MRTILNYGVCLSLVVAATVGIGAIPDAAADGPNKAFPAMQGIAQQSADAGCFANSNGAIINNCSVQKRFCVPLMTADVGVNVQVTVLAPDINHNISCFATTVTRDNSIGRFSGFKSPGVFGSPQIIGLSASIVPTAGTAFTCCDMQPGTTFFSVYYGSIPI
jgi:hypothetical protein